MNGRRFGVVFVFLDLQCNMKLSKRSFFQSIGAIVSALPVALKAKATPAPVIEPVKKIIDVEKVYDLTEIAKTSTAVSGYFVTGSYTKFHYCSGVVEWKLKYE